jgi:hypothetical protein
MIMKFRSKIGKADMKGISSRTIVPSRVVEALDLDFGDDIIWAVDFDKKPVTVTVAKKEPEAAEAK